MFFICEDKEENKIQKHIDQLEKLMKLLKNETPRIRAKQWVRKFWKF